jgi:hypothetical protein
MKHLFFSTMAMVIITACYGQTCLPAQDFWADFSGTAGGKEMQLSFFRQANGMLTGNCRYLANEKDVLTVAGSITGCSYHLKLMNRNQQAAGILQFDYLYDSVKKEDRYTGSFTGPGNNRQPLELALSSMVGGSVTQRYNELFGTTEEVDSFAAKIKTAFITNDKKWLAAHCCYPLHINLGSRRTVIAKTEQEFIAAYGKYISQAYRDRFKKIHSFNMFSNHLGACMGNGLIWINNTRASDAGKYEYCISSVTAF